MATCETCGRTLTDGAAQCANCGAQVGGHAVGKDPEVANRSCRWCGEAVPKGAEKCGFCGGKPFPPMREHVQPSRFRSLMQKPGAWLILIVLFILGILCLGIMSVRRKHLPPEQFPGDYRDYDSTQPVEEEAPPLGRWIDLWPKDIKWYTISTSKSGWNVNVTAFEGTIDACLISESEGAYAGGAHNRGSILNRALAEGRGDSDTREFTGYVPTYSKVYLAIRKHDNNSDNKCSIHILMSH